MSVMLVITLPLPPKELSPNTRVHWGRKARATKKYRLVATVATDLALREQGGGGDCLLYTSPSPRD